MSKQQDDRDRARRRRNKERMCEQRASEMGGAIFVPVALTPYGGWHKGAREWTSRTAHTGDSAAFYSWDERFKHPARTWASATHRAFTLQSVAVAMANAT